MQNLVQNVVSWLNRWYIYRFFGFLSCRGQYIVRLVSSCAKDCCAGTELWLLIRNINSFFTFLCDDGYLMRIRPFHNRCLCLGRSIWALRNWMWYKVIICCFCMFQIFSIWIINPFFLIKNFNRLHCWQINNCRVRCTYRNFNFEVRNYMFFLLFTARGPYIDNVLLVNSQLTVVLVSSNITKKIMLVWTIISWDKGFFWFYIVIDRENDIVLYQLSYLCR